MLGETPVELPVPPAADGRASARLTFALEGYQRVTAIAEGEGPVVRLTQKLEEEVRFALRGGQTPPGTRKTPTEIVMNPTP